MSGTSMNMNSKIYLLARPEHLPVEQEAPASRPLAEALAPDQLLKVAQLASVVSVRV